jgi:hypothetical protein
MIKNLSDSKLETFKTSKASGGRTDRLGYFGTGIDGTFYSTGSYQYTVSSNNYIIKNYTNFSLNLGHTITVSDRCKGLIIFVKGTCLIDGTINLSGKGYMTSGDSGVTAAVGYTNTISGREVSLTPFSSGFSTSLATGLTAAAGSKGGDEGYGKVGGNGTSGSCFGGGNGGGGAGGSSDWNPPNGSNGSSATITSSGNGGNGSNAYTNVGGGGGGGGSGITAGTGGTCGCCGAAVGTGGSVGNGSCIYILANTLNVTSNASINVSGVAGGAGGKGGGHAAIPWNGSVDGQAGGAGGASGNGLVVATYNIYTSSVSVSSKCTGAAYIYALALYS